MNASPEVLAFAADITVTSKVLRDEPVVLFIGIGGKSAILGLRVGNASDSIRKLVLDDAHNFWAAYLEDDGTPFETSVDIEYKPRAAETDYEEFDPSAIARARSAVGAGGIVRRTVKIGVKRFVVRHPPIAVEVAFTRQGGTYGSTWGAASACPGGMHCRPQGCWCRRRR